MFIGDFEQPVGISSIFKTLLSWLKSIFVTITNQIQPSWA